MITIKELKVSYENKQLFNDLNLSIDIGFIHGLVGLNGAGKTTLLNTIYGLKQLDQGSITLHDQPLKKKEIAYLEAENYFYPNINGNEYLSLFNATNKQFKLAEWNSIFRLPLAQLIETYSTGMKKKLALMGILKMDKPIIILDEPFNGLDLETSKILAFIIQRLKEKGKTIIITSHILESLTKLCDKISYLEHGVIYKTYQPDEFSLLEDSLDHQLKESVNHTLSEVIP